MVGTVMMTNGMMKDEEMSEMSEVASPSVPNAFALRCVGLTDAMLLPG